MKAVKLGALLGAVICATASACGTPPEPAGGASGEKPTASKTATAAETQTNAIPDKVVVYYFHGTRRCPTCLGIQKVIEETIEEKFARELEADLLEFESLNFEEEKNKPYVEKYTLAFSTMIVTARVGDTVVKWDNAGKIWDFAHSPDELSAYVEKNVRAYLKLLGAG